MNNIIAYENIINQKLSLNAYYEFLSINKQNKLLEENIKFSKSIKPDITIIMTVYNQAHCLYTCLRSIQNQSIKNLEIIIVDDCSFDNSTEIIKKYQQEDPRIILIEHISNEGVIKSRSDAIRQAKGRYITLIDGDDSFIHKDILKNSLYIAEKANLDIIEFKAIEFRDNKICGMIKNYNTINLTNIVYQPELRTKFILSNNPFPKDLFIRSIWAKLIKKYIFKRMLKDVGVKYTDDFINFAEDTIMVVSLFHLANSYYLMKEIGYAYTIVKKQKINSTLVNKKCKSTDKIKDFDFFKFLKYLVDKCREDEIEQVMAYREIISVNYENCFDNLKMDSRYYEILFFIFNKALNFKYLKKAQKNNLVYLKNKIIQKQNKEIK